MRIRYVHINRLPMRSQIRFHHQHATLFIICIVTDEIFALSYNSVGLIWEDNLNYGEWWCNWYTYISIKYKGWSEINILWYNIDFYLILIIAIEWKAIISSLQYVDIVLWIEIWWRHIMEENDIRLKLNLKRKRRKLNRKRNQLKLIREYSTNLFGGKRCGLSRFSESFILKSRWEWIKPTSDINHTLLCISMLLSYWKKETFVFGYGILIANLANMYINSQ